mmetsp:Transcript_24084/g.53350  ORF Transcript_24084/g.53350 Transcript_24084/m.53350 type:complete len:129 (+) Transcript_24084:307-693(+)
MKWIHHHDPELEVLGCPGTASANEVLARVSLSPFKEEELHTLMLCRGFVRKEGLETVMPSKDQCDQLPEPFRWWMAGAWALMLLPLACIWRLALRGPLCCCCPAVVRNLKLKREDKATSGARAGHEHA